MEGTGVGAGVRKAPTMCNKNERCKNPSCTFFHFSPAANFTLHAEGDLINRPCKWGGKCNKAACVFNHPSPCVWADPAQDAASRAPSADAMMMSDAAPRRPPARPQRAQGQGMDMVEAESDSFQAQAAFGPTLSQQQQTYELYQTRQWAEALEEKNRLLQQQLQQQQHNQLLLQQQQQQQLQLLQQQLQPFPIPQHHVSSEFHQPVADDMEDSGLQTVRSNVAPRSDNRRRDLSSDTSDSIQMDSDVGFLPRSKPKRGDMRHDIRSANPVDMRNESPSNRNRIGTDLRQDLRSCSKSDLRDETNNSRNNNRPVAIGQKNDQAPSATSGHVELLNCKSSEVSEVPLIHGTAPSKSIFTDSFASPSSVPIMTSVVQEDVGPYKEAIAQNMPPPKSRIFSSHSSKPSGTSHLAREATGTIFPSSSNPSKIFSKHGARLSSSLDQESHHTESSKPAVIPTKPKARSNASLHVKAVSTDLIPSSVPGFKFGQEFLEHCSQIVDSSSFKQRFRKEQDGSLAEMHDGMCHPKEWEDRERTSLHNPFQATFENAYSDSELRRETNLTNLYRSIKGIKKTLDHIQKNFKGDTKEGRDQFSVSIYPTLRAAEIDLKNVGNRVYSQEWIITVERMIKFCMHMYFLTTKSSDQVESKVGEQVVDMHSKSLEYAQKFIDRLMDAYQEMWSHHVMPPNCEEFCSLSLATSALARAATGNNKGGGLAGLCRVFFMLPSHIRQKPQVEKTLDALLCYFSDNITRFFELLDSGCPYMVVLMCSSEFYQLRCRFMKNFFVTKVENIPFETLARYLFHGFSKIKASQQLVQLLSSLRCTQPTDDGDIDDLGSIFGIETCSKPPSTISFKTLAVEAVASTTKKPISAAEKFSVRDFVKTFHLAMGLEFEKIERTPLRPQVDVHPGRFSSFRDALQDNKQSDFSEFSTRPQRFVFLNWPKLDGSAVCTITFSSNNYSPPYDAAVERVSAEVLFDQFSKSSESVEHQLERSSSQKDSVPIFISSVSPSISNPTNSNETLTPMTKIFPNIVLRPPEFLVRGSSDSLSNKSEFELQHRVFPVVAPLIGVDSYPSSIISKVHVDTPCPSMNFTQAPLLEVTVASKVEEHAQPTTMCHISAPSLPIAPTGSVIIHALPVYRAHESVAIEQTSASETHSLVRDSNLEIDLNESLSEVIQDHDYHDTMKLMRDESRWEHAVTSSARREHGDWMSHNAALQLWFLDLQRARHAFSRSADFGSVILANFGLGLGRRSIHFDWIGSTFASIGSRNTNEQICLDFPDRKQLSGNFLALLFSWIVLDPYDVSSDNFERCAAVNHSRTSHSLKQFGKCASPASAIFDSHSQTFDINQKQPENDVFVALENWAANKFSAKSSQFDTGPCGYKTFVSCFHAKTLDDPATVAISFISPHKNWPYAMNYYDLEEWKEKTCNLVKSVVAINAAAGAKGSVIVYIPFLIDDGSNLQKIWKPSASEMKQYYETNLGSTCDFAFICLSPWEILEISEHLHSLATNTRMTKEMLIDIWSHALHALGSIRAVQESIFDFQHSESKFLSYGWPDITRSHVPRVQTISRCSSAAIRSVLAGLFHLIDHQDTCNISHQPISECLFDSVSICLFDTVTLFCERVFESLSSIRTVPVKEVMLLMLKAGQEFFEEISISMMEDSVLQVERTRVLMRDAGVPEADIDSMISSSDDISIAKCTIEILNRTFSDGVRQLSNARKNETIDQCEAAAKCAISLVSNLLKDPASISPNRRLGDDEFGRKIDSLIEMSSNQIQWKSHCAALNSFLSNVSFCGTDKNVDFPNGRRLDTSHHRIVAFQSFETVFFFVSATVLCGGPATERHIPAPRIFKWLCPTNSRNDIQSKAHEAVRKFQEGVKKLKEVKPQFSPSTMPPISTPIPTPSKISFSTPRRHRSVNSSREVSVSEDRCSTSMISENVHLAPGMRVLHDVQILGCDGRDSSMLSSEDHRLNLDFEQQMETFISGTLTLLESTGIKRVREDIDVCSSIERDRRINREFEENLRRALDALE